MKLVKTFTMAIVASSALIMTGCNSMGTGLNANNVSDTTKGAIGGAALGALVTSGGDSKDIARGALLGGALGGAGGYALENNK